MGRPNGPPRYSIHHLGVTSVQRWIALPAGCVSGFALFLRSACPGTLSLARPARLTAAVARLCDKDQLKKEWQGECAGSLTVQRRHPLLAATQPRRHAGRCYYVGRWYVGRQCIMQLCIWCVVDGKAVWRVPPPKTHCHRIRIPTCRPPNPRMDISGSAVA